MKYILKSFQRVAARGRHYKTYIQCPLGIRLSRLRRSMNMFCTFNLSRVSIKDSCSGPCQAFNMTVSVKIVKSFQLLIIFATKLHLR